MRRAFPQFWGKVASDRGRPFEVEYERTSRRREVSNRHAPWRLALHRGAQSVAAQAARDNPAQDHGTNRYTSRPDNIRSRKTYGTSRTYILECLARDYPDILDRYEAGEFGTSARAAGIAAGIIKPPSLLDILRRTWAKASPDERAQREGALP